MTAKSPAILRIKAKIRVVTRNFHFWAVLGKSDAPENQSNDYEPSKPFHLLSPFLLFVAHWFRITYFRETKGQPAGLRF